MEIKSIVFLAIGILGVLQLIFFVYPIHKKRMKDATDEWEKRNIKWDIIFLVGRIVSLIISIIAFIWLFYKELL